MTGFRTLATGAPRLGFGNFNISFVNVAAVDVKLDEERRVTLDIERHGRVLESFDVVDGYRPALDVTVTEGVELSLISLVALVAIIASDSVFGSE